jgi:hypothetical protein
MFWSKKPVPPPEPPVLPPAPPVPPKEPIRLGKGHPGVFDGPKNQLETALVAARARTIGMPQFIEALFNSDVYVLPLAKDLVGEPSGGIALAKSPTLFCMNYPEYSALAIYSAPERAKPTTDLHPEFRFAAKVQAGDFLLGLSGAFGLVINPYWDVNMEWNAEQMARISAMMKRE